MVHNLETYKEKGTTKEPMGYPKLNSSEQLAKDLRERRCHGGGCGRGSPPVPQTGTIRHLEDHGS